MTATDANAIVSSWMKNYSDTLYSYVLCRVKDAGTARDILQETFIAGWKGYEDFRNEAEEKTWLFSILKNKLIDHYRKQARQQEVSTDTYFFNEAEHWTKEAAPRKWQETANDTKEFYSILYNCRSKLTTLYQSVFSLRYLDEEDAEHICKVLEITSSNYWVILHRCKLHLRDCLQKNWFLKEQ